MPCLSLLGRFALPGILLVSLLLSAACSGDDGPTLPEDERPRVVIIHSYDGDFRWTSEQHRGIIEGLSRAGYVDGQTYDSRVFYMDTRVNFTTEELIQERAEIAIQTIDEFMPELVIVTDDAAVEYVAIPYLRDHPDTDIAFVFSGVNGDPSTYPQVASLEAPGGQLTGTVERIPFLGAFEAAERIFNPSERVVIFADDSASSSAVAEEFRKRKASGERFAVEPVDFVQISTFEEWKENVARYQGRVDAIALLNYHRVTDDSDIILPASTIAEWTIENSEVPVFGLISDWSADGLVMSYGNSGFKTGVYVGVRGGDILNGRPPGELPILDPHLAEITFNATTADMMELVIPPDELVQAAEVFR